MRSAMLPGWPAILDSFLFDMIRDFSLAMWICFGPGSRGFVDRLLAGISRTVHEITRKRHEARKNDPVELSDPDPSFFDRYLFHLHL